MHVCVHAYTTCINDIESGDDRACFHDPKFEPAVDDIGRELYSRGGIELLQEAHAELALHVQGDGVRKADANMLECMWFGRGSWSP
jgi:hypothetical protein